MRWIRCGSSRSSWTLLFMAAIRRWDSVLVFMLALNCRDDRSRSSNDGQINGTVSLS